MIKLLSLEKFATTQICYGKCVPNIHQGLFGWGDYWMDRKFGREKWRKNGSRKCLVEGGNGEEKYCRVDEFSY